MTALVCALHRYHSPIPVSHDLHHVIPRSMGGPDTAANIVSVCPTGHRNVHVCITRMLRDESVTVFGETTRDLARRALAVTQA